MGKAKKIFTNVKMLILLVCLLMVIVALSPNPWVEGVSIRSVTKDSAAYDAGMKGPTDNMAPRSKERITAMNDVPIKDEIDYYNFVRSLGPNESVKIKTNKKPYIYNLVTKPILDVTILPELEEKIVTKTILTNITNENGTITTIEEAVNETIMVNKTLSSVIGTEDIGLGIYNAPTTNIRKGLDLQGGTRVLLQPEQKVSSQEMEGLIETMDQRLNTYGLSDTIIREASDLSGNQYLLIEIAGVNEEEVKQLISKQGKFEAKILNKSVFKGGPDIEYVCMSADCSGIDPYAGCQQVEGGWACRFRFSITLSEVAAQRQADVTQDLEVITEGDQEYLNESLSLLLDDVEVDQLNIGAELKGKASTGIEISGSGFGITQQEAVSDSLKNMKRLQTILKTGSFPVKLEVTKTDSISPILGHKFVNNAFIVGLVAILSVAIVLFVVYRRLKVVIPLVITSILEVILMLGASSLLGQNLDLAAIAGIIAVVGTGVDSQIIITDEVLKGEQRKIFSWKERMKSAFFIIMGAFIVTICAMFPLLFAGAGLLRGFALMTMVGLTIGVFLTRPAYAKTIEILLKE
ncbi:MAG: MMPL family transporter [bacterium]|nr:MMPL family transporter [bacterium]